MKAKKVMALALAAVMLIATSVALTVAYLIDSDQVKNTFTVGKVYIELDETDVDLYGVKDGEDRVEANEYKLIPGHTYIKDPVVHVEKGSEKSYVRILVTITDLEDVKAAFGTDHETGYFLPQNHVAGWDPAVWLTKGVKEATDGKSATYEFWYNGVVDAREAEADVDLPALFTSITVPDAATNTQILALEEMQIDIVAHAIQADGFDTADEAWGEWTN